MKVLAFDSGAKRAGWGVLEDGRHIASDVVHYPRLPKQPYQHYRMELTNYWVWMTQELLDEYKPDVVVTETVPVYGMNDFSQGYLANVMATTVHAISLLYEYDTYQVSATEVQKKIAIPGKSKKITKPQVRNGVLSLLPELEYKSEWSKVFEETDALAIALFWSKYKV